MNGYGIIDRMYRPLGVGVIKPGEPGRPWIIFTKEPIRGGTAGYQRIGEGDEVNYKTFDDIIAERFGFARDVWRRS